jgi:hypothetical protein
MTVVQEMPIGAMGYLCTYAVNPDCTGTFTINFADG